MKIESTQSGNYILSKLQEIPIKTIDKTKSDEISQDEKNFFINKYPEQKSEIIDYHFYQKNGDMSGVKVGSLFDKRG